MVDKAFDYSVLDEAMEQFGREESSLNSILQYAQEKYRYLPAEAFSYLADKLEMSEAHIYGVATFYENFSLEKKGKYVIKVCDGTACHVRRSPLILEAIRTELSLYEGKNSTDDNLFTVETVSCLGACGMAPVIMINDEVHPSMTADKVKELLRSIKEKENA